MSRPTKVIIRKVETLDVATVNLLRYMDAKCFPEDDPYEKWLSTEWWIAWGEKSNPAGFAGGFVWAPDKYFYLSRAGVLPEFRGNGIQNRLIDVRHRYAKKHDCLGSYTYTHPENIPSNNSLINSGFKLFQPYYRWAGSEFLYWHKKV